MVWVPLIPGSISAYKTGMVYYSRLWLKALKFVYYDYSSYISFDSYSAIVKSHCGVYKYSYDHL